MLESVETEMGVFKLKGMREKSILEFCKKYLMNKAIQERNKAREKKRKDDISDGAILARASIEPGFDFYINIKSERVLLGEPIFKLDEEDLEWLYNKYKYRLNTELEERIEELKKEYAVWDEATSVTD